MAWGNEAVGWTPFWLQHVDRTADEGWPVTIVAQAALGLVMLICGPITLSLPYENAMIRSG